MSISKLTEQAGLSYPTVLSKLRQYPFIRRREQGREILVSIDAYALDSVFNFLMAVLTSPMKKGLLALAYATRKKIGHFLLGGESALQMQLYVKDVDPRPAFEIRSSDSKQVQRKLGRFLGNPSFREMPSLEVMSDHYIRTELSARKGLVLLSRPEKIAVDALSERRSDVYIDQVMESIRNSTENIDMQLLRNYAAERGVLQRTEDRLERVGLAFP
jgi:hypothetical protein